MKPVDLSLLFKRKKSLDAWRPFLPDAATNIMELPAQRPTSQVNLPPHITHELLRRIQSVCANEAHPMFISTFAVDEGHSSQVGQLLGQAHAGRCCCVGHRHFMRLQLSPFSPDLLKHDTVKIAQEMMQRLVGLSPLDDLSDTSQISLGYSVHLNGDANHQDDLTEEGSSVMPCA